MNKIIRRLGGFFGTIRAFYRQIYNRYFGHIQQFEGTPQEICEQIIELLWEGDFYRTSLGHFDFFWMRDFGTSAEGLVRLGHRDKVKQTISWAFLHYQKADDVTLCIDKAGNTFNAPAKRSIDALPWLLHTLYVSKYKLRPIEKRFLNRQLKRFVKNFLDSKSGDIRPGIRYAELRDAVNYDRSAYAIAMVARMSMCAEKLELNFPFKLAVYKQILDDEYWNGSFFKADRTTGVYSSECALIPFYLDVIKDSEKAESTIKYIKDHSYQKLYPLQYSKQSDGINFRFGMGSLIMPNYTGTTIWTWHGTFYLDLLQKFNQRNYDEEYYKFEQLILRHKTYPELLNPDGSWYKAVFYSGDPGMVWAAIFLALPKPDK